MVSSGIISNRAVHVFGICRDKCLHQQRNVLAAAAPEFSAWLPNDAALFPTMSRMLRVALSAGAESRRVHSIPMLSKRVSEFIGSVSNEFCLINEYAKREVIRPLGRHIGTLKQMPGR